MGGHQQDHRPGRPQARRRLHKTEISSFKIKYRGESDYIDRILNNPKSPRCNREAAIKFVKDHPDYFTPRPTNTPFDDLNYHNKIINGDNPDKKFLSRFI